MTQRDDDRKTGALTRRDVLKTGTAAGVSVAVAGGLSVGMTQVAHAASDTIRGYGTTTVQLKDWSLFTNSTGLTMEFTPTDANMGNFMRDVTVNEIGDTHDILFTDGGTQYKLGPEGFYLVIDENHPELALWERTSDNYKRGYITQTPDGTQYGVPMVNNADSFGYWPEAIGVNPNGLEEVSWQKLFENEEAKNRASIDRNWLLTMPEVAFYMQVYGKSEIVDNANLTPEEAKAVGDWAIERKQAGQFRTFHTGFEEQVQLLGNKEVDIINCWEPATKNVNAEAGADVVRYAYTVEGYFKWGIGAYIPTQAAERDNLDNIYRALNYFLDGEYRAFQAIERGYGGPNLDLGVKHAEEAGWPAEQVAAVDAVQKKVDKKYKKPFWENLNPDHQEAMEEEWQRFLNA